MTDSQILQALRICATHIEKGCGLCPQMKYVRCTEGLADESIAMIERLTAENAELRKEIEWKDMVISLAQREQAKALDAADIIDRLTAENAALREKWLWKPVLAGNPEIKGCYLVTVRHWLDGAPVAREAFWNGVDWLSCERRHEITPRVTHWMMLPKAAEEGDKHEQSCFNQHSPGVVREDHKR